MPKKNPENKWQVWLIVILIIFGALWFFGFFDSEENYLEEKYEVLDSFCVDSGTGVDMKSLGSRDEQIRAGLISLYDSCPNSEYYYVTILEPTKECQYSFNGEIIKFWYNSIGQDNFVIPEASKKIIEEDAGFIIWRSWASVYYVDAELNGISEMTDSQLGLSLAYKDYLENGITKSTLYSIIAYETSNPLNCE